jgi:WD40 repeat protein
LRALVYAARLLCALLVAAFAVGGTIAQPLRAAAEARPIASGRTADAMRRVARRRVARRRPTGRGGKVGRRRLAGRGRKVGWKRPAAPGPKVGWTRPVPIKPAAWKPLATAPESRLLGVCSYPDAYALAFSPNGQYLAVGSGSLTSADSEGELRLWDIATGTIIREVHYPRPVSQIAFSPDGSLIAVATVDTLVHIWNYSNGSTVALIRIANAGWGLHVAFAHKQPLFAVGGGDLGVGGKPGALVLYSTKTWKPIWTHAFPGETVFDIVFEGDDRGVAAVCRRIAPAYGHVELFDTRNGLHVWNQPDQNIFACAVVPQIDALFGIDSVTVGAVTKLEIRELARRGGVVLRHYQTRMGQCAFSPASIAIDGPTQGSTELRVTRTGTLQLTLQGRTSGPRAYAFTADGAMLACGGEDGSVTIWSLR